MKMFVKGLSRLCAVLAMCAAMVFGLAACSNGSDSPSTAVVTPSGTETSGGQTRKPTSTIYTVTFNANDGSQRPATAVQTFTAGTPHKLKTIAELGFTKNGFSFAGWGTSADASESVYANGGSYTASADVTLYAMWSVVPVYSVNIPENEHGTVTAMPATATAGTEIILSNTPNIGYQFTSYSVTDADGTDVTVTDGKFVMPENNVTVTTIFTAVNHTIIFNANDGSSSPTTTTQTFIEGIPQALKTIEELGFAKSGFNFAGWGTSADSSEASYADGSSYTATADVTLYALWTNIPVYSVNIPVNANGSVIANPATAAAGTQITLSNTPNMGYKFASYIVTDTYGNSISEVDGKFIMPAKNVNVRAAFNAINYNINVGTAENGCVSANASIATIGTSVTLTATPDTGYELVALTVIYSDGTTLFVSGTGNVRTFTMPAKDVSVSAKFGAKNYNINVETNENGSVTANPANATAGTEITLSNTPVAGYKFNSYAVTDTDGNILKVTGGKFTMPANNVNVKADFSKRIYNVFLNSNSAHATVNKTSACMGEKVTLTIKPIEDYRVSIYIREYQLNGNGNLIYESNGVSTEHAYNDTVRTGNVITFTMPTRSVSVDVSFYPVAYDITIQKIVGKSYKKDKIGKYETDKDGNYILEEKIGGGGEITTNKSCAAKNTTVALSICPCEGHMLEKLICTAEDGTVLNLNVEGKYITFKMPNKNVYVQATFKQIFLPTAYKKIATEIIDGVSYDIVEFGDYPQTIKPANVTIDKFAVVCCGGEYCYMGSDENFYYEVTEDACKWSDNPISYPVYSDGTNSGANGDVKYFRIEPIKWRVLTNRYGPNNNKRLLFAQNVLSANSSWRSQYNFSWFGMETLSEEGYICEWPVDNSGRSTVPDDYYEVSYYGVNIKYNPNNQFASDEKIKRTTFLLSVQEITKKQYGFATEDARARKPTDYAIAIGVNTYKDNGMSTYWLRSPYPETESGDVRLAYTIASNGNIGWQAMRSSAVYEKSRRSGLVPAIVLP